MSEPLTRRVFCGTSLALAAARGHTAEPPHDTTFVEDFDELWHTLGERYCFFGEKRTDWARVRALYRPIAVRAETLSVFTDVVRSVLAELYDAHTHLSDPPVGAPRWPLYDLLAERVGDTVRLAAIDDDSAASDAGLVIGDQVVSVGGQPVEKGVHDLLPRCLSAPDAAADAYAVNVAVAGRRGQERRFGIRSKGRDVREIVLGAKAAPARPDVDSHRLDGGFGYVAIRSFAETSTVEAFDRALDAFRDAPGLVIDVRRNGGGDTAVARPIMGRFIHERRAYATMRRRQGAGLSVPWTEEVEPRGPFTFDKPVVVLTNHWSASMAEGFPMGMRDIGRARIVGTRMMGLGAAVFPIRLDRTGLQAQYSGEPVYDTQGRPRWLLRPDIEVMDGSDILAAGLEDLRRTRA